MFTGLIAAGERTGSLYTVFHHLADHLKWLHILQKKIKSATRYPLFLGILMLGVVSMMMLYVIPQLTSFLLSQNINLPFYTTALIATSQFAADQWKLLLITPIAIGITIKYARRFSESFAFKWDNIMLNSPIFGSIIRKLEIARLCRFFSLTYASGIGILDCLEIASKVLRNRIIKESVLTARQTVIGGSSLTEALRKTNQFPSLVLRMIKVGEDSGNLESSLDNINSFYDRDVNESVDQLLGMIQPTMTVVMGGIMLWISISVFGPLYNNLSKITG